MNRLEFLSIPIIPIMERLAEPKVPEVKSSFSKQDNNIVIFTAGFQYINQTAGAQTNLVTTTQIIPLPFEKMKMRSFASQCSINPNVVADPDRFDTQVSHKVKLFGSNNSRLLTGFAGATVPVGTFTAFNASTYPQGAMPIAFIRHFSSQLREETMPYILSQTGFGIILSFINTSQDVQPNFAVNGAFIFEMQMELEIV
jgi:hypothetical protein